MSVTQKPCTVQGCTRTTYFSGEGACRACAHWYCDRHLYSKTDHICATLRHAWHDAERKLRAAQLDETIELIRHADLAHHASVLRPDHTCSVQLADCLTDLPRGGYNIHIPIKWDDGEEWLARVKLKSFTSPPQLWARLMIRSEYETIKLLRRAGLKVPDVFLVKDWDEGHFELDYFFMTRVVGTPCSKIESLNPNQLANFIHDYALFHVQLSASRFSGFGSLHPGPTPDLPVVAGYATPDHMMDEPPYFTGPHLCERDVLLPTISGVIACLADGVDYACSSERLYLALLDFRDLIMADEELVEETETYILHMDAKSNQFMLDEEGHITGVIDWEWSTTSSKGVVFAAPRWMFRHPQLLSSRDNSLSPTEHLLIEQYKTLGRPDLAECVRTGRKRHRIESMMSTFWGKEGEMLNGLRDAMGLAIQEWKGGDWFKDAMERRRDDEGLKAIRSRLKQPRPKRQ